LDIFNRKLKNIIYFYVKLFLFKNLLGERLVEVQARHPERTLEVWFQDEARFGQQGCNSRVWAARGSRPRAPRQTEYEWLYLG
jgi:hypothetical protein